MAGKTNNRLVERPTILVCPECNSRIYECPDGFRCRSGHEFSAEQLCPGVEEHLRQAWANVVRTLAFHA
jgi:hypothetical protein